MNLRRVETGVAVEAGGGSLPIPCIMGIGMNYAAHAREQGKGVPDRPVVFMKNPRAAALSGDDIVVPKVCQDRPQVDFEAELGVVIGRRPGGGLVRDVPASEALACVMGYVAANDVSARWWQKEGSGGQFCRGKGFDTFCPIGPRVVPAAEVPEPQALRLACRLNGQVMQDASTSDMIFPVAALVAELSRGTTLLPGTLVLTGTPSGVGMARTPPVFLKNGDVVEIEVQRVGTIRNRVRFE
jgi:2-keto-4-pentenoate hydratase/2-oxohepta-3-ene-1,7-dioic acid hydratase in catechol pathway